MGNDNKQPQIEQIAIWRVHSSHRASMHRMAALLSALAICQFIAWAISAGSDGISIPHYLPGHMLMETVSIVIAMMVFAVGWNSNLGKTSGNLVFLACGFFVVGWMDFLHAASYAGMPDVLSHNDFEKHLYFWLSARFVAAITLLLVTLRSWQRLMTVFTKYLIFSALLLLTAIVNWMVIYHQDWLPHLFIAGQGLTSLKINLEYLLIAINLTTMATLWIKMRKPQPFNAALLFSAVSVTAMSELFFTLYTSMNGIYNVLGHIYKVISYLVIYRAVVVESVDRPFHQLMRARKNLALAVEASATGMIMVDERGHITLTNAQADIMFGYEADALIGQSIQVLVPDAYRKTHEKLVQGCLQKPVKRQHSVGRELIGKHKLGHQFRVEIGLTPISDDEGHYVIASVLDVTMRIEHERRINQLINFDPLTGLPNRNLLHDRVTRAIQAAARSQTHVAVMLMDLDNFKNVNDSLGHTLGDNLLIEVGKRLKAVVRESDTVARIGGDEFVIVLADADTRGTATVATKLLESVSQPYQIGIHTLTATSSIGIAMYPENGAEYSVLYQHADTAMYRAKREGRNGYRFFTEEMRTHIKRMLALESAMSQALERAQFYLHYQPQLSIDGHRVVGVEALLRWHHPVLGHISPAEFIPLGMV